MKKNKYLKYMLLILIFINIVVNIKGLLAISIEQQVSANVLVGKLIINSPIENGVYQTKDIFFDIKTLGPTKSIELSINNKDFKTLCENCNSYMNINSFKEG